MEETKTATGAEAIGEPLAKATGGSVESEEGHITPARMLI